MTPSLRSTLEDLAVGWRNMADSERSLPLESAIYRFCAGEIELVLSRHADTDPAELAPESDRDLRATIPDGPR